MINRIGSEIRRCLDIKETGNKPSLKGYSVIEILNQKNTRKGFSWGAYHPDNLSQYWSDDNVEWLDNKVVLFSKLEPKEFDNDIIIPYSIGVVESNSVYRYGYFEAYGHLPVTRGQWPAFWLTGSKNWPPEIDILEGYSKDDSYDDGRRLQSNIHYKGRTPHEQIGSQNHPLLKGSITHVSGHFAMLWEKDKIEFYYNGYLVRRVTDKKVLKAMDEPMRVILNSGIQAEYNPLKFAFTSFREVTIWQKR